MAIKTSTFGGVMLSGEAAKAFQKQFIDNPLAPSKTAQAALEQGIEMLKEYEKNGFVKIDVPFSKK